jgi:ankyrin repeat protein
MPFDVRPFNPKYSTRGERVNISTEPRHPEEGFTGLMLAARYGHTETVKLLVERKADLHRKSAAGKTALSLAKQYKHPDIVRLLRGAGAKE